MVDLRYFNWWLIGIIAWTVAWMIVSYKAGYRKRVTEEIAHDSTSQSPN